MFLPEIKVSQTIPQTISEFYGIQKRKNKMQDGYFENVMNMDIKHYPCVGSRNNRYEVLNCGEVIGAVSTADHIYYVKKENGKGHLYCDGDLILNEDGKEALELNAEEKKMAVMGAYIVIYPDCKKYNSHDGTTEDISVNYTFSPQSDKEATYQCYMCTEDGTMLQGTGATSADANNGKIPGIYAYQYYSPLESVAKVYAEKGKYIVYWLDIDDTEKTYKLKQWIPAKKQWSEVTAYCCISIWGEKYANNVIRNYEGEYITIKAIPSSTDKTEYAEIIQGENKKKKIVKVKDARGIEIVVDNTDIWKYTVVEPTSETGHTRGQITTMHLNSLTLENVPPTMDFVVCAANRIWGCNNEKHEIYASKLGDPAKFVSYAGISSDSYTVTVGSSGKFTGAAVYNDYPVFFKENRIITMYGTKPANYQLEEIECDGAQAGADKSICYMDEYLYYKSRRGVMRFDGNYPTHISDALGEEIYSGGVAQAAMGKYYIELEDSSNKKHMFVYDSQTNQWMEEEIVGAIYMNSIKSNLYAITDSGKIIYLEGKNAIELNKNFTAVKEKNVSWSLETGDILQSITGKNIVNKIFITFELGKSARIDGYIKYDNENVWHRILTKSSADKKTFYVPIFPRRCEKIRLKMEGYGEFRLSQITRMCRKAGTIWQR